MKLTWLENNFRCKELYAPFVLEKDIEYLEDLRDRYSIVLEQAISAGADQKSIDIIVRYSKKIIESIECYYKADLSRSSTIIRNLIREMIDDPFAINYLNKSDAFEGDKSTELQFFRSREGDPSKSYTAKDMLHLPKKLRSKSGNYRFSIPGNPSFYLSNSSYGCWIESGFLASHDFNVAPVLLDGTQKILNLAVSILDFNNLNEFEDKRVHSWLKLYMLTIATSYRIAEEDRTFKSEYIISQAIMMACKKLGLDGVAYYSKRVSDEVFSLCAINLALFVNYVDEYSEIVNHIIMDDAFNYFIYHQLGFSQKNINYTLRSISTRYITNIGNYDRQYAYRFTEFANFDKFLFQTWKEKLKRKGIKTTPWGVDVQ